MTYQHDIASLRRTRLLHWMDQYQINRTELAKRLGVGRAYISLLLIERAPTDTQKTRRFGEKAARSTESKLGMPNGYLDVRDDTQLSAAAAWRAPAGLSPHADVLVPRVLMSLVAGRLISETSHQPPLSFTRAWLLSRRVTVMENLYLVSAGDDALAGYLQRGDVALIDSGQRQIEDRAIYAIRFADELRLRRLDKRFDGGIGILADNPSYRSEELSAAQTPSLVVVGRVLWRAG